MKELLSTAEFAKLCQVEKRTLFYYDEIDLLKPYQVKKNGYRIYHYTQFDAMSMIKAMQAIGMSLKEIKELSQIKDTLSYQNILHQQIEKLKAKQEELQQAQRMLDVTNYDLTCYQTHGCDCPFFTTVEPTPWKLMELNTTFINYITARDSGTVILLNDCNALTLCRKATTSESYDYYEEGGTYLTIFIKRKKKTIPEMLQYVHHSIKNQDYTLTYPYYFRALTSHLLPCEEVSDIYRIQARVVFSSQPT